MDHWLTPGVGSLREVAGRNVVLPWCFLACDRFFYRPALRTPPEDEYPLPRPAGNRPCSGG